MLEAEANSHPDRFCRHRDGVEVQLCSFLNSSLDGCGWSTPHSGYFITGTEHWYPLKRRMKESRCRSGQVQNTSPPTGLEPRNLQPIGIGYRVYAIPAATMFRSTAEECASGKFAGKMEHWKQKKVRRREVDCNSIQQSNGNWDFVLNFVY